MLYYYYHLKEKYHCWIHESISGVEKLMCFPRVELFGYSTL